MAINEVFPSPTVKQVIFQINFPNLFFIENKIGELQIKIMDKFPESSLLFRRQVMIANLGPSKKIEELQDKANEEQGIRIWQFNSPLGYTLNITNNSLDITSNFHKTYKNTASENRFRDIIVHVLEPFFALTKLPTVNRIGLRYVDECPFPVKSNDSFLSHFDTCFRTNRFSIEDSIEHIYRAIVKRGENVIRYTETYNAQVNPTMLTLDFDGSAVNINSTTCLEVTDTLHNLISREYELTIKKPVYNYMRKESKND